MNIVSKKIEIASKMQMTENVFANKHGYIKIDGKEKYKYHFKRN